MMEKLEIRAQTQAWRKGVSFFIFQGVDTVALPLTMKKLEDGERYIEDKPTFTIKNDEAQTLMDDLWHCGFRPSEGSGSAGSLRATEKHLNDMRTIAFDQLDIKEVK